MQKKHFLTPGPSELYFTVPDHLRTAVQEHVMSISHRSKAFERIYQHAESGVRALLGVPETHHIVFTSSATEVWERILQNCVERESFHFVNGSFSQRFYEFAALLGKTAGICKVPFGQGFDIDSVSIPTSAEMICCTQNETSSGVAMPLADIYALKRRYPHQLLAIDAVSAVPYPDFDFSLIDSLFFSVQKGMGMPAGLGVWIFNEACVEKSKQLEAKGISTGTYHSISSLLEKAVSKQTPETPNVLGIYLLGKVCEDMLFRGVQAIRQDTLYKQALMYQLFETHPLFEPLVKNPAHRSHTVAVANVFEKPSAEVIEYLKQYDIEIGSGYGKQKASQIRIANFPTHSREIFERVYDLLMEWK